MSDVKKISPVGNIHGWEESEFGEFVRSEDYAKLEAEAQALRDEVTRGEQHRNDQADTIVALRTGLAALRARVVVVADERAAFEKHCMSLGWETRHLKRKADRPEVYDDWSIQPLWLAWQARARLNGKAVSEGLLRRIAAPFSMDRLTAIEELRALLDGEPT